MTISQLLVVAQEARQDLEDARLAHGRAHGRAKRTMTALDLLRASAKSHRATQAYHQAIDDAFAAGRE